MASILDDAEITLSNGDLEIFRQWVETKLESKDKLIAQLLLRIQKLETEIDILKCNKIDKGQLDYEIDILNAKIDSKIDKVQFDYEMAMRYEN